MQRRTFLHRTLGVSAALATSGAWIASAAPARRAKREYYELRAYRLKPGASAEPLHQFFRDSAIPKLNKLGSKAIGVFSEIAPKESVSVFVLLTFPNLDIYARASEWLKNDRSAQVVSSTYVAAPPDRPAFDRFDSWLLRAFSGMPVMELPEFSRAKKPRLFEMRTYESYSELKAARKVDMFNEGEMDVMREVGLNPVFYGEGLLGPNLPHLTYMTSAEDEASHKKHWEAFGKHPQWDRMKNDPKYADTVSKITRWLLKPADYSQI